MLPKPDCTFSEVPAPPSRWCSTGHYAVETFRREGPGTAESPTRFFQVSSETLSGTFCEPCLFIANWLAESKRGKNGKR